MSKLDFKIFLVSIERADIYIEYSPLNIIIELKSINKLYKKDIIQEKYNDMVLDETITQDNITEFINCDHLLSKPPAGMKPFAYLILAVAPVRCQVVFLKNYKKKTQEVFL